MARVHCLYCGAKFWRPLSFGKGEFCSREHREFYYGRLRKIAGSLAASQIPTDGASEKKGPVSIFELVSSRLATFLPLPTNISAPTPVDRSRFPAETLPPVFETQARIKRWGLRMRFRH